MENNFLKNLNKVLAGITFLFSFVLYILTMAPTTSFWDCGEFIATSVIMGVPHPPGTPLYLLLGNIFSQIPIYDDIGARVNLISPLVSALAVTLLYLIIVLFIKEWRGDIKNWSDALIIYSSSMIGAFTFAVSDSHWFNAVEAEVYSLSTFFTAIVVWLILMWSKRSNHPSNVKYILLIAYLFGLAIGIHLLNLLTIPFVVLIIYFNKNNFKYTTFMMTIFITIFIFFIIYLGIIKGLPNMANSFGLGFPIFCIISIFAVTIYFILQNNKKLSTIFSCFILILIGYSTYTTIFIRANQQPNINENSPDTIKSALAYMNRDQYGDWKILDPAFTLARSECSYSNRWTNNKNNPSFKEKINFVWNYQIKEMYLRYFGWQFIGKEEHSKRTWELKTLNGKIIKKLRGVDWGRYGLPFPLIFGIIGLFFHFFRDWKRALALLSLFLATGLMIILYLNQYDPQPRERDYSYVGSFFAFSIWIGIGVSALQIKLKEWLNNSEISNFISISLMGIIIIIMPITMLAKDFREHNRHGNYVAWDYAYNMLNSCEPNGIIFTNGDNDTFPLWYIQEVEGVRKDVRVVNLSLLNTPWYIKQLKNNEPQINLNLKNSSIENMEPVTGTAYALKTWTNIWEDLSSKYNKYTTSQHGLSYSPSNFGILTNWGPTNALLNVGDNSLKWEIKPKLSNYLRVQDIMILRIIQDASIDRPIYFAVTVSPNNRMGLDDYLTMEGLVYRLTFEKSNNDSSNPRLNYKKMLQNITESSDYENIIYTKEDYIKNIENQVGLYRYKNLNNSEVYFNENIQRLIQNYRSSFLQLGLSDLYSNKIGKEDSTLNRLNQMDNYFPPNIIPSNDPELDIQIGRIFYQVGAIDKFKERLNLVMQREDISIETVFYVGQMYLTELNDSDMAIKHFEEMNKSYKNIPDITYALVQAYAQADRLNDAQEVLENWILINPNDSKAKEMLSILKQNKKIG